MPQPGSHERGSITTVATLSLSAGGSPSVEANIVRVREPLAGEQGDEPREDGVRRPAVELLVGDRANERLVERSATEGRQGAGAGLHCDM